MASNLVEVARWRLRQAGVYSLDAAREVKARLPRKHTRARQAALVERNERREARALAAQLAKEAKQVDVVAGEITQTQWSDLPPVQWPAPPPA